MTSQAGFYEIDGIRCFRCEDLERVSEAISAACGVHLFYGRFDVAVGVCAVLGRARRPCFACAPEHRVGVVEEPDRRKKAPLNREENVLSL